MMTQMNQMMGYDRVVVAGSEGGGQDHAVRLEQNNLSWMKDLLARFCRVGQVLMDECVRRFPVAKACMRLPSHFQSVGC